MLEFRQPFIDLCQEKNTPIYPHKFDVSISLKDFVQNYSSLETGMASQDGIVHSIAARVYSVRSASKKLYFLDLKSLDSDLQVLASANNFPVILIF